MEQKSWLFSARFWGTPTKVKLSGKINKNIKKNKLIPDAMSTAYP